MPTGAGPAAPVGDAARMAEATAPAMMPEPPMGQPMMKKGGKMSKLNKEIRNESEEIGRVKAKLTKHEDKAASKAHKGLKTGGVVMGQGGYKTGGVVKGQGGYKKGGMADGGKMPMKDGKPAFLEKGMMAGGGMHMMPDGSMMKDSAMKMGGKTSKKAFAAGGTVDSGKPVAMPQGRKKPSPPVLINQYAGTYKKGGSVTPAEGRLQKMFKKENAPAMKAAKKMSNEKYAGGGAIPKFGSITETERSVTVDPETFMKGQGQVTENERQMARDLLKDYDIDQKTINKFFKGQGQVSESERKIMMDAMKELDVGKKRGGAMRRGGGVC
jgi:hypothetical protein